MIFSKHNVDDIKKYYKNTIVKFKETGDRLWQIIEITYSEVTCVDVDGFVIKIDLEEEYEVDYPMPGRTVYQSGASAYMLVRKPAKQYYRGISASNTGLLYLRSDGQWMNTTLTLEALQQFVDKPAYQDINTFNKETHASIALNKHFSATRAGQILALHKVIGGFDLDTKKYKIPNLFVSELSPLFEGWERV